MSIGILNFTFVIRLTKKWIKPDVNVTLVVVNEWFRPRSAKVDSYICVNYILFSQIMVGGGAGSYGSGDCCGENDDINSGCGRDGGGGADGSDDGGAVGGGSENGGDCRGESDDIMGVVLVMVVMV